MKTVVLTVLKVSGLVLLGFMLVYILLEPVIPSRFLIQGMAKRIDPQSVPEGEQRVVRFELTGKRPANPVAGMVELAVYRSRVAKQAQPLVSQEGRCVFGNHFQTCFDTWHGLAPLSGNRLRFKRCDDLLPQAVAQ